MPIALPLSRRRRLAPVVLAAVLATACGSTVQGTSTGVNGAPGSALSGSGGELGGSASGAVGTAPGAGTTGGGLLSGTSGTGGSAGTSSGGGFSSGSATTGSAGSTASGAGSTGALPPPSSAQTTPGVTAKEIYIGLVYDENAGAVNQAAGVGAITSGNSRDNERAIIKDINAHGGVAGRKLVPVFARFDSQSSQTLDQQYAAICQQFTQDSPRVFVVDDDADLVESYRNCLAKAGVGTLSTSLPSEGQATLSRYPSLIQMGYPNLDRLAAYQVKPLVEQKYFTPWNNLTGQPAATGKVKVGILTYADTSFTHAVDTYLVPALKKLGYDPQVARISQVTTASDYGAQGAAVKSAQLTFASSGVTHVISFEMNGGLSTLFLPTARSQGYYPRYGINSASASEALNEAGIVEPKQFNGAVGFGWLPSIDLQSNDNPQTGPYSSAARRYCLNVMKQNGITFTSGNAETIALNSCADLYLLKAALDKNPSQVTLRGLITSIESLGSSYQRAGGIGMSFQPGRQDPTDKAYHWGYVGSCNCFRYSGSLQTVP